MGELTLVGRLAAGACAGMTSAFVTYPLDVLRLRLAVDLGYQTMTGVFVKMAKEEGLGSFYRGLGPSVIGIAPYVAVNICVVDLVKKSCQKSLGTQIVCYVMNRTDTDQVLAASLPQHAG